MQTTANQLIPSSPIPITKQIICSYLSDILDEDSGDTNDPVVATSPLGHVRGQVCRLVDWLITKRLLISSSSFPHVKA